MDAHYAHRLAADDQEGLATRAQLLAAGLSPRRLSEAVAGGDLLRVRRRVYAVSPLPPLPAHLLSGGRPDPAYLRHVRAVLLSMPASARASRRTAAVLWGFDLAVEPELIEVDALGAGPEDAQGVDVRRRANSGTAGSRVHGISVTSATATVVDCILDRPLAEGVAVADSSLRARRVTVDGLRTAVTARRGAPGHGALARAVRLVDPSCGSVLESLLRVLLAQHGLSPPRTQYEIKRADGTLVARVDFCWPRLRLVIEADGRRWHDPEDVRDRDRRKANDLEVLGWGLQRFTWADVVHQPDYVVAAVRAGLARRMAA